MTRLPNTSTTANTPAPSQRTSVGMCGALRTMHGRGEPNSENQDGFM